LLSIRLSRLYRSKNIEQYNHVLKTYSDLNAFIQLNYTGRDAGFAARENRYHASALLRIRSSFYRCPLALSRAASEERPIWYITAAFFKILKKHDKLLGSSMLPMYMQKVDTDLVGGAQQVNAGKNSAHDTQTLRCISVECIVRLLLTEFADLRVMSNLKVCAPEPSALAHQTPAHRPPANRFS
jgi:hypothetical protein